MSRSLWIGLSVATVFGVALLWLTDWPLGVPGEWTWTRNEVDRGQWFDVGLGVFSAALAAGGYAAFVWMGSTRMPHGSRGEVAAWLTGLSIAAFGWLWIAQQTPPAGRGLSKAVWVLYYPHASGYFFRARFEIESAGAFLRDYEALMAEGDVFHVGTHPPGLFLLHRGAILACRASPQLVSVILSSQPAVVGEAFAILRQQTAGQPHALQAADEAALWLAALLTQLTAAATVIPLFWVVRLNCSRPTAWRAACLWPLFPAVAVFLPKSDALYPFLGMLFLAVWLTAYRRGSILLAAVAGFIFWCGLFCSLALLPVGLLAGFLTAWEAVAARDDQQPRRLFGRHGVCIAASAVGFLVPVLWAGIQFQMNLFNVWAWNYRNHAAFYTEFDRTYWKWLLVNPLELALGVGLPISIVVVLQYVRMVRESKPWRTRTVGPYVACALVWGLLWLSGKNMGEAARLWLFAMPWAAWLTAGWLERPAAQHHSGTNSQAAWLGLLALQAAACIATSARVFGFAI